MIGKRRILASVAAVVIVALWAAAAPAQENERRNNDRRGRGRERGGPEGGERRGRMREVMMRRGMDRVMEQLQRGGPIGPEIERMLQRMGGRVLIRAPRMNPVDEAHYAIADIHLQKNRNTECLDRLQKVIDGAGDDEDETVWVSHLNRANILRHRVGDVRRAMEEYKRVKGRWAQFAQNQLLRTLEEMGNLDEAAAILQGQLEAAKEPGEKLVLLRRIAEFYKRNEQPDKAIAYYERITKEFSRKKVAKMIEAVQQYVKETADKIIELRKRGRFEDADELRRSAERRMNLLRTQGRHIEADAMEEAARAARQRIEADERERDRRGDRPDDDREDGGRRERRDDDRPPPPPARDDD